jgi:hypothetical protein
LVKTVKEIVRNALYLAQASPEVDPLLVPAAARMAIPMADRLNSV